MEEWITYYKQYEALISWLLTIATGILINRLDAFLMNLSKERKIKAIVTRYAEVVTRRTEIKMYRRNLVPFSKFLMPQTVMWRILVLTFVITMVQSISSNAFADVFGENASDVYFWVTFIMTLLLNAFAIAYATKADNIFHNAVHFSEYREKTIATLAKLGYGSVALDKIDKGKA